MKLDPNDLQFEQYQNFDGTYAYAQNKVRGGEGRGGGMGGKEGLGVSIINYI